MSFGPKTYFSGIESAILDHLCRGKPVVMHVSSRSMSPSLLVDDLIEVSPCLIKNVRVGDIVAFVFSKKIYVHRVVRVISLNKGHLCIRCKGDKARMYDRLVCEKNFLGKVVYRERNSKRYYFNGTCARSLNLILGVRSNLHGQLCLVLRELKKYISRFL